MGASWCAMKIAIVLMLHFATEGKLSEPQLFQRPMMFDHFTMIQLLGRNGIYNESVHKSTTQYHLNQINTLDASANQVEGQVHWVNHLKSNDTEGRMACVPLEWIWSRHARRNCTSSRWIRRVGPKLHIHRLPRPAEWVEDSEVRTVPLYPYGFAAIGMMTLPRYSLDLFAGKFTNFPSRV